MLDYIEMFDYFKSERKGIVEAFEKMPNGEFVRNRELSFYSLKDVFLHTIDVEESWLHYSFPGKTRKEFAPQNYMDIGAVKERISEVDAKTAELFKILTSDDMKKPVWRKFHDGRETTYPMEAVLYHVPIEIIHHYGEIFAEFWKMNVNAPYFSYLRFSETKKRA